MPNSTHTYENTLTEAGIRITAVRLLVLRTVTEEISGVFSLNDITSLMGNADPSSVFRSLTLFAEHHIIHEVDDGSGMQKYCLCRCIDRDHHQGHIHFTCTQCHQTFCMRDVPIPNVALPDGFLAQEAEYVVKGICNSCRKRHGR